MTNPISDVDGQIFAANFLRRMQNITDKDNIVKAFDELSPFNQEFVIRELETHLGKNYIEIFPYIKYKLIYDKIVKSDVEHCKRLVSGISTYYYEDAEDLLRFVFQETKNADVCEEAARGLANSINGLDILKASLQNGNAHQQHSAIKAIANNVYAHPSVTIMMRHSTPII